MWYPPWYCPARAVLQPAPGTFLIWGIIHRLHRYGLTSAQIFNQCYLFNILTCICLFLFKNQRKLLLWGLYTDKSWIISHLEVLPAAPAGQVLHDEAVFSAYWWSVLVSARAIPATVAATLIENREINIEIGATFKKGQKTGPLKGFFFFLCLA